MRLPFNFSPWSISGVPSSQAPLGFLITAPPSVLVPAVLSALNCGFKTNNKKKGNGEVVKLWRPSSLRAAAKSGASGLAERTSMMLFESCTFRATFRQPRAAAAGRTAENPRLK